MSVSIEERLKRRKLDALKRGIHRVGADELTALPVHVVGIGRTGVNAIRQIIADREPDAPKLTALALDIGEENLRELRALSATTPTDRVAVETVALTVPDREDLFSVLSDYDSFLRLEYPNYRWPANGQPWLPRTTPISTTGPHFERAVAKAIYGHAYYSGQRTLHRALRSFADGIEAEQSQAVVAVIFGMGGGTGSGIALDLARHLSNGIFGRRVLVAGIAVAPCDGDAQEHTGAQLFTALSELDILGDEQKNRGVVMSCGDMFRNPFTAGFIVIPQQHVWQKTRDIAATNSHADKEIASLLTARGGANLWELLRLLNWVAAPSTQHSAARTPWGPRWIHMLVSTDTIDADLKRKIGLLNSYRPEFIEVRISDVDASASRLIDDVQTAFAPEVPPQLVGGGGHVAAQFVLPRIAKTDLIQFYQSLGAYNAAGHEARLLNHSLLLDQGIMLCEPSSQLEGMAGASLEGGNSWVAVPFTDIRGQPAENATEPVGAQS